MMYGTSPTATWLIGVCNTAGIYGNSPFQEIDNAIEAFKDAVRRNPKWRPWHGEVSVRRVFDMAAPMLSVLVATIFNHENAASLKQRRQRKRRHWCQSLRRD